MVYESKLFLANNKQLAYRRKPWGLAGAWEQKLMVGEDGAHTLRRGRLQRRGPGFGAGCGAARDSRKGFPRRLEGDL